MISRFFSITADCPPLQLFSLLGNGDTSFTRLFFSIKIKSVFNTLLKGLLFTNINLNF